MFITTLQLTQMVVGIVVTVTSVVYHARGVTCYVSLTNSALGLLMYASYFVLFLQLFLSHYVYSKKKPQKGSGLPSNCPSPSSAALSHAAEQISKGRPVQKFKGN